MKKSLNGFSTVSVLLIASLGSAWAQKVGDHATGASNNQRTRLNSHMGNFGPALQHVRTLTLDGVSDARSLLPVESIWAVTEDGAGPGAVHLFEVPENDDQLVPSATFTGLQPECGTRDSLAFANDILLFGQLSTAGVQAVRVADGMSLWEDIDIGCVSGRSLIASGNKAYYAGEAGTRAANLSTGVTLWTDFTTTLEAPIALQDSRLFVLSESGSLMAFDTTADGALLWSIPGVGSAGSSIIANEKFVFLADPVQNLVGAIDQTSQTVEWSTAAAGLPFASALALAYDQLLVFSNDTGGGQAGIVAYNPETGDMLWGVDETDTGIEHAFVANNAIYYYNTGSQRIRVRDAFNGVLLWSILKPGLRDLVGSERLLLALLASSIDVYESSNSIFFARAADGPQAENAQSTLLALANISGAEAAGSANFFAIDGSPLLVPIDGMLRDSVDFTIPARGAIRIQTEIGDVLQRGWIRIDSDQPLRGSSIFQFSLSGVVAFEAGVAASAPTGEANIFVQLLEGPGPLGGIALFSTGVAIANPFDEETQVSLILRESDNSLVAADIQVLGPGEQIAAFIHEIFEGQVDAGFEGVLQIQSPIPVIVTALRTVNGIQLSSVPVGQTR